MDLIVASWVLGNRLQDNQWKNEAMRKLFTLRVDDHYRLLKRPTALQDIVANTGEGSKLRIWVLDQMEARMCKNRLLDKVVEDWPTALTAELLKRFAARTRSGATGKPQVPADSMQYLEEIEPEVGSADAPVTV